MARSDHYCDEIDSDWTRSEEGIDTIFSLTCACGHRCYGDDAQTVIDTFVDHVIEAMVDA